MSAEHCDLLCLDLDKAETLRANRLAEAAARAFAEGARALSDPTRLAIAVALRDGGELCVCDLSWIMERAQNLVSHHLRALRQAGLADFRREQKMALYSLTESGAALLGAVAPPALDLAR